MLLLILKKALRRFGGPLAHETTRLTTNNKQVASLSLARFDVLFLHCLGRKRETLSLNCWPSTVYQRSCGAMDNAFDYESEDGRITSLFDILEEGVGNESKILLFFSY